MLILLEFLSNHNITMIGLHWEQVESVSNSGGCEDEDTLTHTDTYTLDKNNKENKNNNNIAAPFSNLR